VLDILTKIGVLPVFSLFFIALIKSVDYLNMEEVESILLTNSKKIIVNFSKILLMTIIYFIIFGIISVFLDFFTFDNPVNLTAQIIAMFLVSFMISFSLYLISIILVRFLRIKMKWFVILDSDHNKKWYVARRLSGNNILLTDGTNYRFYEFSKFTELIIFSEVQEKRIETIQFYLFVIRKRETILLILFSLFLLSTFLLQNAIIEKFAYVFVFLLSTAVISVYVISAEMKFLIGSSSSLINKIK
jgi:hypothetical protein